MEIKPVFESRHERPYIIAGPCSAESEEQVLATARALAAQKIDLFRAGIWKPRTSPGAFEGVGVQGLKWLRLVKQETGLKVTTEVANTLHVFEALKHDIDVLWIGARTTVSPFAVQEIADALRGVDVPVLIKNPINPDVKLWVGAIKRLYAAGITRIGLIHRGFSTYGDSRYRNAPQWQIAIDIMRQFPDMTIVCDNSHICGRRDTLQAVAQKAMDLNFDGLMTEVHPNPDKALSDAEQQITPDVFEQLIGSLTYRRRKSIEHLGGIDSLRHQIDDIDHEVIELLSRRMKLARGIGEYKRDNNISILQPTRWNEILENAVAQGVVRGLSEDFTTAFFKAVHQESINQQAKIMNEAQTLA